MANTEQVRRMLAFLIYTVTLLLICQTFSVAKAQAAIAENLLSDDSDSDVSIVDSLKTNYVGKSDYHSESNLSFTFFSSDSILPDVSTLNPVSRSTIFSDSSFTIQGNVTDDDSGVRYVRVRMQRQDVDPRLYWNGSIWQESPTNMYQTTSVINSDWSLPGVDLSEDGEYRVQLLARDNAGNQTDPTNNISYFSVGSPDTIVPNVSTFNPVSRSIIDSDSSFTLQGNVTDDASGVRYVRVRIQRQDVDPRLYWNGSIWQESPTNMYQTASVTNSDWSLPGVDLSEYGEYRVQLLARDNAGNQTDPTNNISYFSVGSPDTIVPNVSTANPVSRSTMDSDSFFTILGGVTDDDSGVRYVRVRIQRQDVDPKLYWNGFVWQESPANMYQSASVINNDWSLPGVDLSEDGEYRVQLLARDNAGNQTDPTKNISYFSVSSFDSIVPNVSMINPVRGSAISANSSYTIEGAVVDESGVQDVQLRIERWDVNPRLYWNGSIWQPSVLSGAFQTTTLGNNFWSLSGVDLSQEGDYRIQLLARDNLSNQSDPNATAIKFSVGGLQGDCLTTHIYLLAGQSNANGQAGYFLNQNENLPGRQPTGENAVYLEPYDNICYAYRTVSRQTWAVNYNYELGPLDVRYGNNGFGPNYTMGTETSLGRMLDGSARNPQWQSGDKVCLLKFGAGGTPMNSWHPNDPEGLHTLFMEFLSEKISELEQTECRIELEDFYWIQGEGDTSNMAKVDSYVQKFREFIASVSSSYPFRPVFSQIKSPNSIQSPNRAINTPLLNQRIKNAGYLTTIDNNDLVFIDQNSINTSAINQHYNAASYIELGRRLAQTSAQN